MKAIASDPNDTALIANILIKAVDGILFRGFLEVTPAVLGKFVPLAKETN